MLTNLSVFVLELVMKCDIGSNNLTNQHVFKILMLLYTNNALGIFGVSQSCRVFSKTSNAFRGEGIKSTAGYNSQSLHQRSGLSHSADQCPTTKTHTDCLVGVSLHLVLHGQVEFELGGQLVLAVQPVREVHSPDPAVGVDLHSQGLDVVCAVGPPREV